MKKNNFLWIAIAIVLVIVILKTQTGLFSILPADNPTNAADRGVVFGEFSQSPNPQKAVSPTWAAGCMSDLTATEVQNRIANNAYIYRGTDIKGKWFNYTQDFTLNAGETATNKLSQINIHTSLWKYTAFNSQTESFWIYNYKASTWTFATSLLLDGRRCYIGDYQIKIPSSDYISNGLVKIKYNSFSNDFFQSGGQSAIISETCDGVAVPHYYTTAYGAGSMSSTLFYYPNQLEILNFKVSYVYEDTTGYCQTGILNTDDGIKIAKTTWCAASPGYTTITKTGTNSYFMSNWNNGCCEFNIQVSGNTATLVATRPECSSVSYPNIPNLNSVLGCSNNNPADTNGDGIVDRTELGAYITKWINAQITRDELAVAIQAWSST